MNVIRSAVSKYGKPSVFNFDNGSNYRSYQMSLVSARMGSTIHYCLSGHRKVLCGVYDYVEFHIKSKAAVEGTVYYSTIAIVGKLRNRKILFF